MYTDTYVLKYTYVHINTYIYIYIYVYMRMYIYMHVYIYMHIYIFTRMHTHTHIYRTHELHDDVWKNKLCVCPCIGWSNIIITLQVCAAACCSVWPPFVKCTFHNGWSSHIFGAVLQRVASDIHMCCSVLRATFTCVAACCR